MDGYYLLNDFGVTVPAGSVVIPAAEFETVTAATRLIEAAEARARGILAKAEHAYEGEKKRGYRDGLEQARLDATQRLLDESRRLDIGLQNIQSELSRVVVACVRKLIGGFSDVEKAEAVLLAALRQMRQEKRAELRVPPPLFPRFRATIASLASEYPDVEIVDVIEDAALSGSHIILETAIGRVDGNLDSRLNDLDVVIHRTYAGSGEAAPEPGAR